MEVVGGTIKVFARSEFIYYYYSKVKSSLQKYLDTTFEATQIIDNLWLGAISSACNREELHKNNIDTIISAFLGSTANYPYDFNYQRSKLRDIENEDILTEFRRLVPIIHQDLTNGKGILCHCHHGKSRSASIVAAYLIKYNEMTTEEALKFIKSKRSQVSPNQGYITQLELFEKEVLREKLLQSQPQLLQSQPQPQSQLTQSQPQLTQSQPQSQPQLTQSQSQPQSANVNTEFKTEEESESFQLFMEDIEESE